MVREERLMSFQTSSMDFLVDDWFWIGDGGEEGEEDDDFEGEQEISLSFLPVAHIVKRY